MAIIVLAIHWVIRALIIALIVRAIASWVAPMSMHPAILVLNRVTDPLLEPIRNAVGVHSGVDFSPLIAILVLSLIDSLILGLV